MDNLFTGSWIPKLVALLTLVGTGLMSGGEPYTFIGQMINGLAATIGFMVVRQNSVSSEAAGAKPPPQVIMHVDEPTPSRSHHK